MFGSVPLRTYLPDGDIDVSIFCEAKGLQVGSSLVEEGLSEMTGNVVR